MGFVWVCALASLFVFGGLFTYRICERRHRSNWRRGHAGTRTRAPKLIRRTALWSIYMGQMALPGGLLGLFGTLFAGVGLLSIPGMILAVRIWRLGYAMLRRDPDAEQEARKLEQFAVALNIVVVSLGVLLLALLPSTGTAVLLLTLVAYAGVSAAHAKAMRRCAELLETKRRLDEAIQLGGYRAASPADRSPRH
jgi:hypothetical protein